MFLGVDGGGTKTALVLVDRDGTVRASHSTTGSYHPTIGLDALGELLTAALHTLLRAAGVVANDVEFGFFGLPAYGEDRRVTPVLDGLPSTVLRPGAYLCGNDMVCGWAGAFGGADGINAVAGTGSICYGERAGARARCGGWGELFSDEGSAYWIACRGLNLFTKISDGLAPLGPLYELARQRLNLVEDLDLCGYVYGDLRADRALIANLSHLVIEAAEAGDEGARRIIQEGAEQLALMVDATRRRLGFSIGEPVPVSVSGGLFEGGGPLLRPFAQALVAIDSAFDIRSPVFSPVVGAAVYAAACAGQSLSSSALGRLRIADHKCSV